MVLADAGFLVSGKSSETAERELVFLGKHVHFGDGTILNTQRAPEDALSRYVLMASRPVTRESVSEWWENSSGRAGRHTGPTCFWHAPHVQWGAKWLPHAPTNLLRSLSGVLWFAGREWRPPRTLDPPVKGLCPQVFSDAAWMGRAAGWAYARRRVRTTR